MFHSIQTEQFNKNINIPVRMLQFTTTTFPSIQNENTQEPKTDRDKTGCSLKLRGKLMPPYLMLVVCRTEHYWTQITHFPTRAPEPTRNTRNPAWKFKVTTYNFNTVFNSITVLV